MIPIRRRAVLQPGCWYIASKHHGWLVVTLSAAVPHDSELEHQLVRDARAAWKQQERRGLTLAPVPVAGAGLGWLLHQARRPVFAAGTAVAAAGVMLAAVTIMEVPGHPPAAAAPPASPRAGQTPPTIPGPLPPSGPRRQTPETPARPAPGTVAAASVRVKPSGKVKVRLPVGRVGARLPVSGVPPVHVTPPPAAQPPPVVAAGCRLVRLQVGRLVRVCV